MTDTPHTLILFGATGDLARRMLLPSLYNLDADGLLPAGVRIIGTARSELSDDEFRQMARDALAERLDDERLTDEALDRFAGRLSYVALDATTPEGFDRLAEAVGHPPGDVAIFLSTAPFLFEPTIAGLRSAGLTGGEARIGLEKPLGHDLESSRHINDAVAAAFPEERIFRIDHYLGKETVQNLLVLRFANVLFEPLWNAAHIAHVQITVSETVGLEGRASFYDDTGALRDMVQNHMLQLLSLIAMEPPATYDATAIRDEKVKVLRSLRPIGPNDVKTHTVIGQYAAGAVDGQAVPGYAQELEKTVHHRDLRRGQGACRQLALGGRAVLPAHRKAAADPPVGDRHPVQAAAAFDLRVQCGSERPGHSLAARGVHPPACDGQTAGPRPRRRAPAGGAARPVLDPRLCRRAAADRL